MDTTPSDEKPIPTDNMPTREFTVNDVIKICADLAYKENIMVQIPTRKPSIFRRFSEDLTKLTVKAKSGNNSDSDQDSGENSPIMYSQGNVNTNRMEVVTDSKIVKDTEKPSNENIPGLRGRDVVAIAILVDNQGVPMKTYTEHEDIPSEEYDAANQVYISRVPFPESPSSRKNSRPTSNGLNVKTLYDFLSEDIDVEKANKLKRRMTKILVKLHTTDLQTAQSFLKLERFEKVRHEIRNELVHFVEKDLKMDIVSESDES